MVDYIFSKHAMHQFERRGIDKKTVDNILRSPKQIIAVEECVHVYQSLTVVCRHNYLVRIFVNICREPYLVVTGYRTSKIDKYEG